MEKIVGDGLIVEGLLPGVTRSMMVLVAMNYWKIEENEYTLVVYLLIKKIWLQQHL